MALAQGAVGLEEWKRAERAAAKAARLARMRAESRVLTVAEGIIGVARAKIGSTANAGASRA
jgi:hypothetical protein